MTFRTLAFGLVVVAALATTACSAGSGPAAAPATDTASVEAAAHHAHDLYLLAINSNNVDAFLGTVTDDIVFMPPNSPAIQGKKDVGAWVKDYFGAYQTSWDKTSKEFVVVGDLAYEWYAYKSEDVPRPDGPAKDTPTVIDEGNGINIYRKGADGVWRVARDAWSTAKKTGQ